MKKLVLITAITMSIVACQNGKKPAEVKVIKEVVSDSVKIERMFTEFKTLYVELLSFKDSENFKLYGFGNGGDYKEWLTKVEELKNNKDAKLLVHKGIVAGELEQLGILYASSKGKETDATKFFNKTFKEAITNKPVEKVVTKSGNDNYDNLVENYTLIGKWKISNSAMKMNYPYEIYKKGDEYIGVIPEKEYKTEILIKSGTKYTVKGNSYGEYYKIDSNMNMTLYDKDGGLSSMGYKATKL